MPNPTVGRGGKGSSNATPTQVAIQNRRYRNNKVPVPVIDRLNARLEEQPATGCLIWSGPLDRGGYGRVAITGRRNVLAHRVAYEHAKEPIPQGLSIDHLCRNPACCNPEHMEVVSLAENSRRSWEVRPVPTHCARGHEFSEENTYRRADGRRQCRACRGIKHAKR